MMEMDANIKQSELLELLWKLRSSEPNRSVSSMLKDLRLTKQAAAGRRNGIIDDNSVKWYDVTE